MSPRTLVIGAGRVGSALIRRFKDTNYPDVHDPARGMYVIDFLKYQYIFICVDTLVGGPDDYHNLNSILLELSNANVSGLIVIRSTIAPNYIQDILTTNYSNLRIVLFPEFMTDKELNSNFPEDKMIILGGDSANIKHLRNILTTYKIITETSNIREVSIYEASMIKISANAILATKVTTFNIIKHIGDLYGVDYSSVIGGLSLDIRLGAEYHSTVPGPDDGKYGFGGNCLPKDTKALSTIDPYEFFTKVLEVNKNIRSR